MSYSNLPNRNLTYSSEDEEGIHAVSRKVCECYAHRPDITLPGSPICETQRASIHVKQKMDVMYKRVNRLIWPVLGHDSTRRRFLRDGPLAETVRVERLTLLELERATSRFILPEHA